MFVAQLRQLAIALALCVSCTSSSTPAPPIASTRLVGDAAEPLVAFDRFLDLLAAGQLAGEEGRSLVTPGFELNSGAKPMTRPFCDTLVRLSADHAVARVHDISAPRTIAAGALGPDTPAVNVPALTMELYWHLRKDGRWRVEGVRSLAYPELLMVVGYAQFDRASLPAAEVAEFDQLARNARLTLSSDAGLTAWFQAHTAELQSLAERMRAAVPGGRAHRVYEREDEPLDAPFEPIKAELVRLGVLSAEISTGRVFDLVIGGAADNLVLFRHVPSGESPHVSIDDVIWAEDLGGGWFLVKTT